MANFQDLTALIEGRLAPDQLVVRFDPAFNRAIDFAIGEGLVKRVNGARIELTESGKTFADEIFKVEDVYTAEKELASGMKLKVSESLVDEIFGAR